MDVEQLKALYRSFVRQLGGSELEADDFADRSVIADLRGTEWQGIKALDMHGVDPLHRRSMHLGREVVVEREAESGDIGRNVPN